MTVVAWSSFYDEVLPWVPGCPTTLADAAIRRTVIELCDRALILPAYPAAINAAINTGYYVVPFATPTNMDIAKVLTVRFLNKRLKRRSPAQLDEFYGDVNWRDAATFTAAAPSCFMQEGNEAAITLVPAPNANATGAIQVTLAVRPTEASTGIDDAYFVYWRTYVRVIADGALAYLKRQPRKPWTDIQGSGYHTQKFEDAIGAYNYLNAKGKGANDEFHTVAHFR